MKPLLLILALVLAAPAPAQDVADPDLRAELLEMVAADQDIRQRAIEAGAFVDSASVVAFAQTDLGREMMEGDSLRLARVVEIVDTHGWPTASLVGTDGVDAAFLIVQHGDLEVQARMLPLVECSWRAGDLEGQSYALLLDRVRLKQGEPQVYGTQVGLDAEGEFVPTDLADPETVDARRAEVGMMPLAEYLEILRGLYAPAEPDAE